jgi:PAS domain S-box-containing protein
MISWSSFPVKDFGGEVEDIGFVGNIISEKKENVIKSSPEHGINNDNADYFNEFEKIVKNLEKDKKQLEKKNLLLQKKLKGKKGTNLSEQQIDPKGNSQYHVSDFFGGGKKKQELHTLFLELDQREKHLNKLEVKLEKDKQKITEQKKDLIKWRKKLEKLESEIESRIKWVENKEKAIENYIAKNAEENSVKSKLSDEILEEYQSGTINKIDDCAAVVQRGVLKEVNSTLVELLGYKVSEIVEKSIFDFITPEGFSGIEKYYFKRLKGENVSVYDTILLTKDNVEVSIKVNTKPTIFNGEKAELIVFKKLNIQKD